MTPSDRTDLHLYVRFIEVTLGGWDTHSDNFVGTLQHAKVLDQAMSAFANLQTKGLLAKTLVVLINVFVRTPHINDNDGRDHQDKAVACLLAGDRDRRPAAILDPATSALLVDLHAKGLMDQTLVVLGTEFGRTVLIDGNDGRDPLEHRTRHLESNAEGSVAVAREPDPVPTSC
jgi:uncharacterized protein (DUF1501 family)